MAGILILLLPIPVISANYDHYSAAMTGFQEIKKKAHKSKKWARNAVHPSVDWDENKNSKNTHLWDLLWNAILIANAAEEQRYHVNIKVYICMYSPAWFPARLPESSFTNRDELQQHRDYSETSL